MADQTVRNLSTGDARGLRGSSGADRSPGDEDAPGSPQTGEVVCPECQGAGRTATGACANCGGTGRVVQIVGDA